MLLFLFMPTVFHWLRDLRAVCVRYLRDPRVVICIDSLIADIFEASTERETAEEDERRHRYAGTLSVA